MKKIRLFALAACLAIHSSASADEPTTPVAAPATGAPGNIPTEQFTFRTYLHRVGLGNLELVAQRANVSSIQAQIAVARVFPDPTVTAGLLQYDLSGAGNPAATIVQVNVPLQIGGQRSRRIAAAEANLLASRADLDELLRSIRASAANSYIEALHARLILERKRRTLTSLERLAAVNEQRLRAGDIGETAVLQSRVEANQFRAEVLDATGGVKTADLALVQFVGKDAASMVGHTFDLRGDLTTAADKSFDVPARVQRALGARPDLVAARRRQTAAARQIELARANRIIDVGVGATWQHNFALSSPQPPLPSSELVGATLSVPLPFSRMYRGELDAAYANEKQTEALSAALAIKVEVEVRSAVTKYEAAAARVKLYTGGVLHDADQVLEKTLYNFQRGGATLVEVLVAQRTDNDVYLSYYDALADAAHALVAVEQAVGTWDVDL